MTSTTLQQRATAGPPALPAAVAAAGLEDVTPHDLRAMHASWIADARGGVMTAARRLGHANASVTTRHYARPIDERDGQDAKHLDKLGTVAPGDKIAGISAQFDSSGGHLCGSTFLCCQRSSRHILGTSDAPCLGRSVSERPASLTCPRTTSR